MSHPTTQSDQGREQRSVIEEAATLLNTFGVIGRDEHGRAMLVLPGEYGKRLAMLLGADRTEEDLIEALRTDFVDYHQPEDGTAKEEFDPNPAAVDADLDGANTEMSESANNGNSDDSRVDVQFTMLKLSGNQAAIMELLAGSGFDELCDNLPGLNTPVGARDDGRPAV